MLLRRVGGKISSFISIVLKVAKWNIQKHFLNVIPNSKLSTAYVVLYTWIFSLEHGTQ